MPVFRLDGGGGGDREYQPAQRVEVRLDRRPGRCAAQRYQQFVGDVTLDAEQGGYVQAIAFDWQAIVEKRRLIRRDVTEIDG
ncbi:hypothetical protein UE98_15210 [Burkholderia cenocepacia]|nr:hypothetical protein UE98_15210 [Burkholderia cenocepacia]